MNESSPFVRYRKLLESYRRAIAAGIDDDQFVALVRRLDAGVAAVDGGGFHVTPFGAQPELARAAGLDGIDLWVKDETGNVAGSHKARHLFGLWLHAAIDDEIVWRAGAAPASADLAIASCGNAALAAAVIARAVDRRLRVFVPADADEHVVARLRELGAGITVCPREPGVRGDPCYQRLRQAIAGGAHAFTCQGSVAPGTIDGGRTIAWELAEQLAAALGEPARLDRVFVQVGGGALATAVARGLVDAFREGWLARVPALHAVQTAGAFPLVRAWDLLAERVVGDLGRSVPPITSGPDRAHVAGVLHEHRSSTVVEAWLARAAAEPEQFMWPWEDEPRSLATGIIDDVTYDWLGVVEAMFHTGGWPVIVDDDMLRRANDIARTATTSDVDVTGTAGLAGMMAAARFDGAPAYDERVAVLFTGVRRG